MVRFDELNMARRLAAAHGVATRFDRKHLMPGSRWRFGLALLGLVPCLASASPAPDIVWSAKLGAPVYAAPRHSGGQIYVTSTQSTGPNVFALDAHSGAIKWRYATSGAITVAPTVGTTQVFVASDIGDTHFMRALDAKTGALVWQYTRNKPPECMCSHDAHVGNGLLFAQTDGHSLYAFAPVGAIPSQRIWQFKGDGARLTDPVTSDGLVLFGSANHSLYALDAKTGAVRWTAQTGYGFVAAPVVAGGIAIAGNRGGTVHAYAVATGKPAWNFATAGAIDQPAVIRGDRVYVVSEDRTVYALGLKTGHPLWQHRLADYALSAPVLAGGAAIVADRAGDLLALDDATGKTIWRTVLAGTPLSRPILWHEDVVLKIGDHMVAAYAASTGASAWDYTTKAVVTDPVATSAGIALATSGGRVLTVR
jgi:outer membrane protein assembly factor BamB